MRGWLLPSSLDGPVYRGLSRAFEIVVGAGKVAAAKKASVGGEWGGVWRLEYAVFLGVDKSPFLLCVAAPQHKDQLFALFVEALNGGVCKPLPAPALVRSRLALLDAERSVEQKDALFGPGAQIT